MGNSIPSRLQHLKKLATIYIDLPAGALINKHLESLRIFIIQGSTHPKHPHNGVRVYISRKALKHFIESRTYELRKRHTREQILELICFALDSIQETVLNFDLYELEPPKHFYTKDYSHQGKPQLRILLENTGDKLEIISIHFKTRKNK